MTQTVVAFADPAKAWAPNRTTVETSRSSRRKRQGDCPLAIIGRGVVLLSILGGLFGYAVTNAMHARHPVLAEAAALGSELPGAGVNLAFAHASLRATPPLIEPIAPIVHSPQNRGVRRTFLRLLQTALESPNKVLQFGPMRVKRSIVETIIKAAQVTHTDPVLLMAIADKESSFETGVEARTSSAMGLFQFVDSTWLKAVRDFGAKYGLAKEAALIKGPAERPTIADPAERKRILDLRSDPYLSAVLAAEMLKRDGNRIAQRIGRGLTSGETYLAHFLGPDDAERFMEKVVGQPQYRAAVLLPRPAHANASLFYARGGRRARELSVAAVHDKFEEMMGMRLDRYKSIGAAAGLSAYADLDGH